MLSDLLEDNEIMLLDVGAKGGTQELSHLRRFTHCHGFEPNRAEADLLTDPDSGYKEYRCFPFALGAEEGEQRLHIARHSSYSSFLEVDWALYDLHFRFMPQYELFKSWIEAESQEMVPVRKLDALDYGHIDLLKMDTQGTELEILKGAERKLGRHEVAMVKSEVSFVEVYKNGALFSELDAFFRSHGFLFIDCIFFPDVVYEKAPPEGRRAAYQDEIKYSAGGDALYVLNPRDLTASAALKAGLLLADYRYFSFAEHYLRKAGLPGKQIEALLKFFAKRPLKQRLIRWAKAWLPRKLLYRLSV